MEFFIHFFVQSALYGLALSGIIWLIGLLFGLAISFLKI